MMNDNERSTLDKLEAQVAYNEKMLNDLNDLVTAQAREIEQLKAGIEVLGRQILQITEGEVGSH
jgi:uncharacterized coiled-coil protein SlyX